MFHGCHRGCMIALKALKYKILEYCVNVIFEKVKRNFLIGGKLITPSNLRIGMPISEIHWMVIGYRIQHIFKDCKIERITLNHFGKPMMVSFSWSSCDGLEYQDPRTTGRLGMSQIQTCRVDGLLDRVVVEFYA